MAYATQYKIEHKSKTNVLTTILLERDGYSGSVIELEPGASAPELSKDESAPFMGTELSFAVESSSVDGIVSLYTEDPRGVRVTAIRDSETIFQGFLVPEQYSDPYIDAPFDITLSAVDGLGLLKKEDFDLTGYASEIDVITHILTKTGLSLITAVSVDVRVFNGYWGRALDMSYINCNQFYTDKGAESCYDVLSKILMSYDITELYVTQHAGRWLIFRTIDILKEFTLYNIDGSVNYTDTFQFLPLRSFDSLSENQGITSEGSLTRDLSKRLHKIELSNKLGRRSNMLSEILTWPEEGVSYWSITDGNISKIMGSRTSEDGEFLGRGFIENTVNLTFNNLSSSSQREYGEFTKQLYASSEEHRLYINTRVDGGYYFNTSYLRLSGKVNLPVAIILQGSSNTYILTDTGWEVFSDLDNQVLKIEQEADAQQETEILMSSIPEDGVLKIRFYRPFDVGVNFFVNVKLFDVNFNVASLAPAFINYSLKTTDNVNNSTEEEINAEAPLQGNDHLLYQNIKLNSNLLALEAWRHNNDTTNYKLSLINLRANVSNNRKPKQILKGTLMGSGSGSPGFNLNLVYVDYSVSSTPYFWLKSGSWNLYEDTLSGDFEEILPYQEQTVTIDKTVISENYSSENKNPVTSELSEGGSGNTVYANWNNLVNKPTTFPPSTHQHVISDIERLGEMFEYQENSGNPLIRAKLPLVCDAEITAWADNGQLPPTIWESLPYATATSKGAIKVGSGLAINNGVLSVEGSVGQGFDESANYNPSGDWNFTGLLKKGGNAVATESWATGQFESKFTKNTAFNKNFGTASGTVAQGNDSRINNGQTAYGWGDHASQGYATQTWVGNNYHVKGGASDQDFTVKDLVIHGTVNHWMGDVITVDDARLQLNRTQDAATVASGIDVYNGTSVVSSLLYGTDNRWKIGGQNIATESWSNSNFLSLSNGGTINNHIFLNGILRAGSVTDYFYINGETGIINKNTGGAINFTSPIHYNGNLVATENWVSDSATANNSTNLGGYGASDYLRRNVNETISGTYIFNNKIGLGISPAVNIHSYSTNYEQLRLQRNGVEGVGLSFYNSNGKIAEVVGYAGYGVALRSTDNSDKLLVTNSGVKINGIGEASEALDVNGNILASGEVTAYSDARLKNILNPTTNVLDRINALTVYDYTRKDTENKKLRTGLLAQDLQKQFPQFVSGQEGKDSYLSINYSEYAATVATKGIQELYEIIQDQAKRIQELEKKDELI